MGGVGHVDQKLQLTRLLRPKYDGGHSLLGFQTRYFKTHGSYITWQPQDPNLDLLAFRRKIEGINLKKYVCCDQEEESYQQNA